MAGILVVMGTIMVVFIFWSLLKLDECETKAYLENFYKQNRAPKQGKYMWGLPEQKAKEIKSGNNTWGKYGRRNEKNF
jgi:hypothetical protein